MRPMNKRGVWENLSSMAIGIITFVVIATVGALMLAQFKTSFPKTTFDATNASGQGFNVSVLDPNVSTAIGYGQAGVTGITSWIPVIIVVAIGAVLIALVAGYFVRRK